MPAIKIKIEHFFKKLTHTLYEHPLKVLALLFIFIGYMCYMSMHITVDSSAEAMFREDDPTLQEYKTFLDQFGRPELVLIAVKSDNIFTDNFLKKLKDLHDDLLEQVPHVKQVTSLINARNTKGRGDTIIVEALLEDWPEKKIDLPAFKKQVLNNPYYVNNIISEDGLLTAVVIEFETSVSEIGDEDNIFDDFDTIDTETDTADIGKSNHLSEKEFADITRNLHRVINKHNRPDFTLAASGGLIISDVYNKSIARDQKRCFSLSMLSAIFFMMILFRRISGVILPGIIVLSAVYATTGCMVLFNKSVNELSVVIQPFLISVGIADSVHVLTIFYRKYQQGSTKREAIIYAMGHSGLAIVLTSLTTAAGLFSFAIADITAIADMGIFSGIGVLLALIFTIFMLPSLLALIPIKKRHSHRKKSSHPYMDLVLQFFTDLSTTHPKKILISSIILFFLSFIYIFHLEFSHNPLDDFPDTMQIKKDVILIDNEFKGIAALEVVIDTDKENGIYEPDILNRIETLSKEIKEMKKAELSVGKVFSINDILKETNKALHNNDPSFYSIPQDRQTIAQEFLLFENSGSEDLYRIVDRQFSKTRFTVKTPNADAVTYKNFIHDISKKCREIFKEKAKITCTGFTVLLARTIPLALKGMAESYVVAFVVITIMMILLIGSIKIGLVSMIPNILPIAMVMGLMGYLNIPLNLSTMMIGSIAIGLVVDDTVHFMYNFQKYFNQTQSSYTAIQETLLSTGRAMLTTSLILSSGFFILLLAELNSMSNFGLFTGLTIILALLADFLVAPALMTLLVSGEKDGL